MSLFLQVAVPYDDCHGTLFRVSDGYGPPTSCERVTRRIGFTVHTIMVSGARICEDSGSTFTLQSPGELSNSNWQFTIASRCGAGEIIMYRRRFVSRRYPTIRLYLEFLMDMWPPRPELLWSVSNWILR